MSGIIPIRRCSRLMIVSPSNRLLLFRYDDEHSGEFWATVGGELQGEEDYRMAAKRELYEETGSVAEIGDLLEERDAVYAVAHSTGARWLEQYFLVRVGAEDRPSQLNWTGEERETITRYRWWSVDELAASTIELKPPWIGRLLQSIVESK